MEEVRNRRGIDVDSQGYLLASYLLFYMVTFNIYIYIYNMSSSFVLKDVSDKINHSV